MGRPRMFECSGAMLNFGGVFKSIHVYSCSYDLDSSKLWKLQSRMIRKLLIFINSMTWLVGNEETCQGTMNQIESMNPTRFTENPNAQTHVALKLQIENSPKTQEAKRSADSARCEDICFLLLVNCLWFSPIEEDDWWLHLGRLVILKSCSWNRQLGRVFGQQRSRRMPRRQVRMGSQNSFQLRWRKERSTLESRLLSVGFLDFKDSLGWWIIATQIDRNI